MSDHDQASGNHPTTLFAAGEVFADPWSAKSTICCANIAGMTLDLQLRVRDLEAATKA